MFLFLVVYIFLIGYKFKCKMYLVYDPEKKGPTEGGYAHFPSYTFKYGAVATA